MANISIKKSKIPFLFAGGGDLKVSLAGLDPLSPLPPGQSSLADVKFGAAGGADFVFGRQSTAKLKIAAGAKLALRPIWSAESAADRALLEPFGLVAFQRNNPDRVTLFFDTGADVSADFKGAFQYSLLTATVELSAAADARLQYLRSLDETEPAAELLGRYFGSLRLPAQFGRAPEPGEAVALEYSGSLGFGAGVSIGYEAAGSPDFSIGGLKLTEKYDVQVAAGVQVGGSLSGRFRIQVGSGVDCDHPAFGGAGWEDWARVTVRKGRSTSLNFAADVNIQATNQVEGLPDSADEFLGAALGVNAQNWLNWADRVHRYSEPKKLKELLDGLSKQFIQEWTGKGVEALDDAGLDDLLKKVERVVTEYESVDRRALKLFDRYFSRLALLEQRLQDAAALASWDRLRGQVDPELWRVVEQLTDGDPLGWLSGLVPGTDLPSLPELQRRAHSALDFLRSSGHREIKEFVSLAKRRFGLDPLVNSLAQVDTLSELRALADARAIAFAERFTGKAVDKIANSKQFGEFREALDEIDEFKTKWYGKLTEAVNGSFSLEASYAYSRASEHDALVDVLLDLSTQEGKRLMAEAASGDFQEILASAGSPSVRVLSGVLADKWTRSRSFRINLLGWHDGWSYEGFDKLVVGAEQRIVTSDTGALTVYTQAEMKTEKQRIRNGERTYTSFLLQAIAETGGVLQQQSGEIFDMDSRRYLIDAVTGMSMQYDLVYEDPDTKEADLQFALSFAEKFGLAEEGARFDAIEASLPRTADHFGWTQCSYTVRFAEDAALRLFQMQMDPELIRTTMRRIVLANYAKSPDPLREVAWAYVSEPVATLYRELGRASFTNVSSRILEIDAAPFSHLRRPGGEIRVDQLQLRLIALLYEIERDLVKGFMELRELLTSADRVTPRQLEKRLKGFGTALKKFDDVDGGTNTIFAVFDQLLRELPGGDAGRRSTLEIRSKNPPAAVAGQEQRTVTKRFVAGSPLENSTDLAAASAAGAGS